MLPPPPPHKYTKHHSSKSLAKPHKLLYGAGIVILAAFLVAVGIIYFHKHPKSNNPSRHQQTAANSSSASSSAQASTSTNTTPQIQSTSYTSVNYNTSFSYPSSWTVTDNAGSPLTITSPAMQLKAANGSNVLGQIVLTLTNKGNLPKAFGTQAAAVLASQKITYTNPSPNQAAASYVSFVQYATTTTLGGMDAIYLSGNYGYQQAQTIPASDLSSVDPLAYFSFYSCLSSQCSTASGHPLTLAATDWSSSSFSAPLLLILTSFTFD